MRLRRVIWLLNVCTISICAIDKSRCSTRLRRLLLSPPGKGMIWSPREDEVRLVCRKGTGVVRNACWPRRILIENFCRPRLVWGGRGYRRLLIRCLLRRLLRGVLVVAVQWVVVFRRCRRRLLCRRDCHLVWHRCSLVYPCLRRLHHCHLNRKECHLLLHHQCTRRNHQEWECLLHHLLPRRLFHEIITSYFRLFERLERGWSFNVIKQDNIHTVICPVRIGALASNESR
mmetsp:Transcript_24333/g.43868  ORF Transcript_24333/g.43868 Transcript_24333/m.43868 type:complete len:230 (+) Transcript_24333:502-1191(+)